MLHELFRTIDRAQDLSANKESVMYQELDRALKRALLITRELTSLIKREKVNTRRRLSANLLSQITAFLVQKEGQTRSESSASLSDSRRRQMAILLDIYVDLALLEERIAGRMPAYEGIRVVRVKI